MALEIKVPSLGQSVPEATVGKWLKQVGDEVATDEAVVELETDKINMEVTAFKGGTLAEIRAEAGETVAVGDVLGVIAEEGEEVGEDVEEETTEPEAKPEEDEEEPAEEPSGEEEATEEVATEEEAGEEEAAEEEAAPKEAPAGEPAPKPAAARGEAVIPEDMRTSPAVRRLAREHRLDLTTIEGSGREGRVTKQDVLAYLEEAPDEAPEAVSEKPAAEPAATGAPSREYGPDEPVERVPMPPIRKTIAQRMSESKRTAAHVTTVDEADMSALVELRESMKASFFERHGFKLTYMPFIAKAAIAALKEFPEVNATIDGDEIVYHRFYHLGIAVHTEAGLVVPVVKHADRKSMTTIAGEIDDLATRARERTLEMDDITGGTFTLTNAGGYGAILTTPIISYPEVAVLGIHKIEERPVAVDGKVEIRPMMYLALSYDHRLVDGTPAVQFLRRVCELLEDPDRLLIEA
ncbi:MAG: 2-oxoglutarate dehydrogenase complex dihydrolipoyllysine-residue succinyltransferase [Gemmatimonadota bacterium]|nr:2-oxoglutarate dehydrogenase complex dihydrolipoyllysine-residue succinyltransferase [Gemmatimonadota bacterium]